MKFTRIALIVLPIIALALATWTLLQKQDIPAPQDSQNTSQNASFDYYVLALSWSPTFCRSNASQANRLQCNSATKYGFIVHGLWPQYEKRGWPEFCDTPHQLDTKTRASILDLIPSKTLITHQWTKHGSCTGLSPRAFFATLRTARNQFTMPFPNPVGNSVATISPQEIKRKFSATNTALPLDSLHIACTTDTPSPALREVRICLDKDLNPRKCSASVGTGCRARSISLPPIR